ncbi:MAG: enoyl-CoA hydratase [Bacillota bacterium]|nr:MAG: enoyl-CoA hydratase [Bacillota bacterium]HIO65217.1 enoyl-CoA hydratase [Planctomycetota bacterium]
MEDLALKNLLIDNPAEGIMKVTVNRPEFLNALDDTTVQEIERTFSAISTDDSVRVVIVTGAGEKAFVAGADIQQLAEQGPEEARQRAEAGQRAFDAIERCGRVVIAQINGFALGGGCELALACHLRYASSRAKLGLPEVTLGIIPGYGGTQRLQRIIGRGRAFQMILTGDFLGASEAAEVGLVNGVCEAEDLEKTVMQVADTLCKRGPIALKYAIEAILEGGDVSLAEGQRIEADLFSRISDSEDMREGMNAFLDKRTPEFRGK